MMRLALDMVSACASVLATIKSTPCSPDTIMLLIALPPAPPTPNTIMRAFISRMSVMSVISASRFVRPARSERIRMATDGPCDPLPLSPQPEAPVCVLLFPGCRSNDPIRPLVRRKPSSRAVVSLAAMVPAVACSSSPISRSARSRSRSKSADDGPPLLRAGRFPPARQRSLPPTEPRFLAHSYLVAAACAVFPPNPRSPTLCHYPTASVAAEAAWQANERPPPRSSAARQARHMSVFQLASAVLLERTRRSVNRKVTTS